MGIVTLKSHNLLHPLGIKNCWWKQSQYVPMRLSVRGKVSSKQVWNFPAHHVWLLESIPLNYRIGSIYVYRIIDLFIYLSIYLSIDSFIYLLFDLIVHLFIYLYLYLFIYSFLDSFICLFIIFIYTYVSIYIYILCIPRFMTVKPCKKPPFCLWEHTKRRTTTRGPEPLFIAVLAFVGLTMALLVDIPRTNMSDMLFGSPTFFTSPFDYHLVGKLEVAPNCSLFGNMQFIFGTVKSHSSNSHQ